MRVNLLESERVRSYIRGKLLLSVPTAGRRVALTFDDGPSPRNTPVLLDVLSRHRIRATFFLVGAHVRRHPELVTRIAEEGHEIANHSEHHLILPLLPTPLLRREILKPAERIEALTGKRPRFFRPPMGWFSGRVLRVLAEEGFDPVIGSINPQDSRRPPAERIEAFVMERVGPGSVVILHDGGRSPRADRSGTVEAVDRIAGRLLADGYRFETLSELTADEEGTEAVEG